MFKQKIGVIGMGVMGYNLSLNMERNNFSVSIFNRSSHKTQSIKIKHPHQDIIPFFTIKDFVKSLDRPRRILLMVKAGKVTDDIIQSLLPFLQPQDIIIDGGNSFYKDTIRREKALSNNNIYFIGAGISGGEDGALNGPCIMPGGTEKAYNFIKPIFQKIAAKLDKDSCVDYIGPDGSGHYVKMVHNGIEYGDMQLIAESYFLLKILLKLKNEDIADIFELWNKGELKSYLIEITAKIIRKKDNKGKYLIDSILDVAENKGTGRWVVEASLDLGEPLTLIAASVFARYLSSMKAQRIQANQVLKGPICHPVILKKNIFIEQVRRSLYLGKVISYAQGFSQLQQASDKYNWNLNLSSIANIFRSGCIIRANFLQKIHDAYYKDKHLLNLILSPYFLEIANTYHDDLRKIVILSIQKGISIPTFLASITYYDGYRTNISNANLIQAQRDFFGSHTYQRIDKKGIFHTEWTN
ncbi:decarboxylating NADP(+)-dependent phosphogluconate dehydrogenase [Buchnera aphidicola (Thelaxes californica)]|uniref:6-phosphogluconate dehydrogenase, decarboxylating n=1 Tax=Buchnera aphidicola (Thelaxes californica) TaxID=1315998 RepID=A0A4D6YNM5_9GAMM|nr:decarboxylating NADP(+)-dependent phosphogluconate dehydrogenase [Buchnera aphidicola]QCI26645.1 decarboxylating NADP(+)-dependent phosphogluconate dehydrogenase [Buchnera aphidicola (Thelaxes californica)]